MFNEEKVGPDTGKVVRGLGIEMPKYDYQEQESHPAPGGIGEKTVVREESPPYAVPSPPPIPSKTSSSK